MLRHKGIAYTRRDLIPGAHRCCGANHSRFAVAMENCSVIRASQRDRTTVRVVHLVDAARLDVAQGKRNDAISAAKERSRVHRGDGRRSPPRLPRSFQSIGEINLGGRFRDSQEQASGSGAEAGRVLPG